MLVMLLGSYSNAQLPNIQALGGGPNFRINTEDYRVVDTPFANELASLVNGNFDWSLVNFDNGNRNLYIHFLNLSGQQGRSNNIVFTGHRGNPAASGTVTVTYDGANATTNHWTYTFTDHPDDTPADLLASGALIFNGDTPLYSSYSDARAEGRRLVQVSTDTPNYFRVWRRDAVVDRLYISETQQEIFNEARDGATYLTDGLGETRIEDNNVVYSCLITRGYRAYTGENPFFSGSYFQPGNNIGYFRTGGGTWTQRDLTDQNVYNFQPTGWDPCVDLPTNGG